MPQEGDPRILADDAETTDERQPLLGPAVPKLSPTDEAPTPPQLEPPNLKVVLPALMMCAFLAAFDVTVVAAIYPIMYDFLGCTF
jgi:hypothetical protein